jgi:hypothetical protein
MPNNIGILSQVEFLITGAEFHACARERTVGSRLRLVRVSDVSSEWHLVLCCWVSGSCIRSQLPRALPTTSPSNHRNFVICRKASFREVRLAVRICMVDPYPLIGRGRPATIQGKRGDKSVSRSLL